MQRLLTRKVSVAARLRPVSTPTLQGRWLQQGGLSQTRNPVNSLDHMVWKGVLCAGGLLAGVFAYLKPKEHVDQGVEDDVPVQISVPESRPTHTHCIISYCTKIDPCNQDDDSGLRMCRRVTKVMEDANFTTFHGGMVNPGENWQREFYGRVPYAKAAVVMLSSAYFQSEACVDELATLLEQRNLPVIPVIVGDGVREVMQTAFAAPGANEEEKERTRGLIRTKLKGNWLPPPGSGALDDANFYGISNNLIATLATTLSTAKCERPSGGVATMPIPKYSSLATVVHGTGAEPTENALDKSEALAKEFQSNPLFGVRDLNALGEQLLRKCDYNEAMKQYTRSLELQKQPNNNYCIHDRVATLQGIGNLHFIMGNYREARLNFEKSLEMIDEELRDSARQLNSMLLGPHYGSDTDPEDEDNCSSWDLYAQDDDTDIHGPQIAALNTQIGNVFHAIGDYDTARTMHADSLVRFERIHGNKPHSDVTTARHGLANTLCTSGSYSEAQAKYEANLKTEREIHGLDAVHPNIAAALHGLGNVCCSSKKFTEAKVNYEASLDMNKKYYGADVNHPSIAATLHQLGDVLSSLGDLDGAKIKLEASLDMNRKIHGADSNHPAIAATLYALGSVLRTRNDTTQAKSNFVESLEMSQKVHGEDAEHPDIAVTLQALGDVHYMLCEYSEASRKYKASLDMLYAIHGRNANNQSISVLVRKLELAKLVSLGFYV